MCLIVVKDKEDASFSVQDFRASFSRNSDGTGIMYVEDGRIKVEKAVGIYKNHLDMYYKHMHRKQFVLHHRMATHGEKTEMNVHPFKVTSIDDGDPFDLYFVHNGVFPGHRFDDNSDKRLSDTHMFALQYLQPLVKQYPDIINSTQFQIMLHDFIGQGNKLAFLRNDGLCLIFNKQAGDFHNGCWLSNKYSINSYNNTTYYGKKHGAWGGYDEYEDDKDIQNNYSGYKAENDKWREDYKKANEMKAKAETTMSGLDINGIVDAINEYAGMSEEALQTLFMEEPFLVYDMINLLETKTVSDGLLNEEPVKIATQLNELLQMYTKKKAA